MPFAAPLVVLLRIHSHLRRLERGRGGQPSRPRGGRPNWRRFGPGPDRPAMTMFPRCNAMHRRAETTAPLWAPRRSVLARKVFGVLGFASSGLQPSEPRVGGSNPSGRTRNPLHNKGLRLSGNFHFRLGVGFSQNFSKWNRREAVCGRGESDAEKTGRLGPDRGLKESPGPLALLRQFGR